MDKEELCFTFGIQPSVDCLKRSFERSFKQTLNDLCLILSETNFKSIIHEALYVLYVYIEAVNIFHARRDSQVLTWHITT